MSAQTIETNISVNNTNVCLKVNSAYLSEVACSNLYDQLRNRVDFVSDGSRMVIGFGDEGLTYRYKGSGGHMITLNAQKLSPGLSALLNKINLDPF